MTVESRSLSQSASINISGNIVIFVSTDSSDKLRQPKIGALMKQVMGAKEDVPGTFSRGGEAPKV